MVAAQHKVPIHRVARSAVRPLQVDLRRTLDDVILILASHESAVARVEGCGRRSENRKPIQRVRNKMGLIVAPKWVLRANEMVVPERHLGVRMPRPRALLEEETVVRCPHG